VFADTLRIATSIIGRAPTAACARPESATDSAAGTDGGAVRLSRAPDMKRRWAGSVATVTGLPITTDPTARAQISPRALTASRSSASSATEASILPRENSSMSSPWTISHDPPLDVTGNPEMRPAGTS